MISRIVSDVTEIRYNRVYVLCEKVTFFFLFRTRFRYAIHMYIYIYIVIYLN